MVHLSAARVIAARSTGAVSADFVLPWGQDVPARVVNADGDGGLTQRAATSALGKARFTGVPPGQAGVFHGFLPIPSFRCAYTVLGRLLSLATPTVSPLDG